MSVELSLENFYPCVAAASFGLDVNQDFGNGNNLLQFIFSSALTNLYIRDGNDLLNVVRYLTSEPDDSISDEERHLKIKDCLEAARTDEDFKPTKLPPPLVRVDVSKKNDFGETAIEMAIEMDKELQEKFYGKALPMCQSLVRGCAKAKK